MSRLVAGASRGSDGPAIAEEANEEGPGAAGAGARVTKPAAAEDEGPEAVRANARVARPE